MDQTSLRTQHAMLQNQNTKSTPTIPVTWPKRLRAFMAVLLAFLVVVPLANAQGTGARVGLDIASKTVNGVTTTNIGFASLVVNGTYGLYAVNLLTGDVTFIGKFDGPVVDIAFSFGQ